MPPLIMTSVAMRHFGRNERVAVAHSPTRTDRLDDPPMTDTTPPQKLLTGLVPPPDEPQAVRRVKVRGGTETQALRLWPRPGAWRFHPESQTWKPMNVEMEVKAEVLTSSYFDYYPELHGWEPLLSDVLDAVLPTEIRDVVIRANPRNQLRVLRLLHSAPGVIDLADSNIGLVVALASRRFDKAKVQPLLSKRRRDLLPLLDLPGEKWIVRLLARVCGRGLYPARLKRLLDTLRSGTPRQQKMLRHASELSSRVLDVVCGPYTDTIEPTFVEELTYWDGMAVSFYLDAPLSRDSAVNSALKRLRASTAGWNGKPFRSLRDLRRDLVAIGHCDPNADDLEEVWEPARYPSFPDPPAGGLTLLTTPRISLRPLSNATDLRKHGRRQRNCLPSEPWYPDAISAGRACGYEVEWVQSGEPRVGTLWLDKRGGRGWRLGQLLLSRNAEPPPWVARALKAWTRDHLRKAGVRRDLRQMVLPFGAATRVQGDHAFALPSHGPESEYRAPSMRG